MLGLLIMITPQLILLICRRFIANYQQAKKVIPLTRERALSIKLAEVSNSSNSTISQNSGNVSSSQDEELISILQDLQQNSSSETNSSRKRISWYFCSDTVFNLSSKVLTDIEINTPDEGLGFAPRIELINLKSEQTFKSFLEE